MLTRILSILAISLGLFLLANATLPIVSYELFASPPKLLSPVPKNPQVLPANTRDLTRASNWFIGASTEGPTLPSKIRYYTLSIPKLKIEDATVEIGGEDLSRSLIHYQGTALPGRPGNAVVFGHSVLPQFFNPKNYLTIFSTLPKLEEGDEVSVSFDGITYKYRIFEMFEVQPSETWVLEQNFDDSYLTLITCVPPGTYLRRLVVRAKIVPPQASL